MKKAIVVMIATMGVALVAATAAFANNPNHKVVICHVPPGNPANAHTIEIGLPALEAHLRHGDYLGECVVTPPSFDQCPDIEGNQPEGYDCNPVEPPVTPPVNPPVTPPGHDCVYTGAGKDGNLDAFGGSNDDCAPLPTPPVTTVTTVPSPPEIQVVYVDRIVPKVVYKTKTKIKKVTVFKTKVKVKTKIVYKVVKPNPPKRKVCPVGTKLYHGTCAVMGSG